MNKKVLTLCAGVLLVGGSAIFTVNAMNAGNEKVQTTYVVKANAEGVAGYELASEVGDASYTWSLMPMEGNNGDYYLSPVEGYFMASDGSIKSIKTSKPEKVTILADLSISFDATDSWLRDGKKVYLWSAADKKQSYVDLSGKVEDLALATAKTQTKELASGSTIAAYISLGVSDKIACGTYNNVVEVNTWTLKDGKLSVVGSSSKTAYLLNDLSLLYNATENVASFKYEDGKLLQAVLGGYKQVYITSEGLTTEEKVEGAQPAALYEVKEGQVNTKAITTTVTEGTFVIAQAIEEEVVGDTKYVAKPIESVVPGAPGAEYGHIDGIVFNVDGTLDIVDNVTTAKVPVYIYYTVDKVKYYLTPDKGWSKDVKTVWTLVDGNLVSVAEEPKVITGVTYVKDGIEGINTPEGKEITIALSQTSLMAEEIDKCELPLLSGVTSDYVYLGGYSEGMPVMIVQDDLGNVSLSRADQAIHTSQALWKVTKQKLNDGRWSYIFTNRETEDDLTINGYRRFIAYDYNGGVQLLGVDINGRNEASVIFQRGINVTTSNTAATVIGFYQSKLEKFTAHWLLHRYGSSFQLNVVDEFKENATINGNVFEDADLVPVVQNGSDLHEIISENDGFGGEEQFLLKKKGTNLYIALNVSDKWSNATNDFVDGGYKFELLSEANMKTVLSTGAVNGKSYYPYFRITYLEGVTGYDADGINEDDVKDNTPAYCIEIGDKGQIFHYDLVNLVTTDANGHKDVFVTANENCGHNDARKPKISFYTDNENIVRGEDATNNPLNYRYVNISFKAGANMQFKNEKDAWVNLNGKVLGINQDGVVMPTEADYFLFDKAEGQWAVSMQTNDKGEVTDSRKFVFTNRENPSKSIAIKSMHALGNDVYAVEYEEDKSNQYSWLTYPFGFYTANGNIRNQVERDTLVIKAAEGALKFTSGKNAYNMDSYANWTKEELQDKTFQLSIDAAAQLYVTENEGKDSHFLGLTDDATKVTNWRLVPFTAARVHDKDAVKYLTAGTDSVYTISHPMYHTASGFKTYTDTTAIVTYALQNIQNNEWLTYDPSQNQTIESMICDPNSKNFTTANLDEAYRFVLKEKAEGTQKIESGAYNIIGVTPWGLNNDKYVTSEIWDKDNNEVSGKPHYVLNYDKKLYGATSYQKKGAIEVENMYLQPTSNDIFTIATTASQEYVKATPMDTVRIYGAEENDYLLYENGQFLNMGNKAGIAPAMVLDTAYYNRPGNNRYQYLIVLNPNYVPAVPCEIEGHPALHPDTMYGRFLVNQIDSAVMVSRNHNNKFINDIEADEKELKLGFQWGYRTGDKLYLTAGKDGKVIETIDLSTPDFNKAKFAFKYVNEAVDKQFKVQTAWYDYDSAVKAGLDNKDAWTWNNEGYLRSVNGVIVVTNGYTHGEEFLMAQENSDPTANENITAGNVVVAGVDGAVVVKGAEGKNVIVSTILGKVVANEVVSSDNATIAAPAGIVVVSVDGESFKVVVK